MLAEPAAHGAELPLQLWLLTDQRPGHRRQLEGLATALQALTAIEAHWLETGASGSSWLDVLRGRYRGPQPPEACLPPDIAVAAGHRTHRELLALRRARRCFCAVLMRPSLPTRCFDAIIAPHHDGLGDSARTLGTAGVLTPTPRQRQVDQRRGLILIGGESRHYRLDSEALVHSIGALCARFPELQWQASDSRRTPPTLLPQLRAAAIANLELFDHRDTPAGWVDEALSHCAQAWVTEDSVSMLYESLSAGACTGVLPALPRRPGRVQRGVQLLLEQQQLNRLEQVLAGAEPKPPAQPLREAERAARWLLARWQLVRWQHWQEQQRADLPHANSDGPLQ